MPYIYHPRKIKYFNTGKSKNSKITFPNKVNKLGIMKFNSENANVDVLTILPTFMIKEDKTQIKIKKPLELNLRLKDKNQSSQIKNLKIIPQELKNENVLFDKNFQDTYKSIGQIFVVDLFKKDQDKIFTFPKIESGTFSIVNFGDNNPLIVTALHLFLGVHADKRIIILNFDEKCIFYRVTEIFDELYIEIEFMDENNPFLNIEEKFKENFKNFPKVFVADFDELVDKDFLFLRQNLILEFCNHEMIKNEDFFEKNILLDPEFNLQPLPSIDVIALKIPYFVLNYLEINKIHSLKIANKNQHDIDEEYFAVSYNCIKIELDANDYIFTIGEIKNPTKITSSNFTFKDKSVSLVKMKKNNNNIITNYSTLFEGSSGCPILNNKGEIMGFSCGYFEDNCEFSDLTEEQKKSEENLLIFDKIAKENTKNYKVEKNSNIAINSNHLIFELWNKFYFWKNENKLNNNTNLIFGNSENLIRDFCFDEEKFKFHINSWIDEVDKINNKNNINSNNYGLSIKSNDDFKIGIQPNKFEYSSAKKAFQENEEKEKLIIKKSYTEGSKMLGKKFKKKKK